MIIKTIYVQYRFRLTRIDNVLNPLVAINSEQLAKTDAIH